MKKLSYLLFFVLIHSQINTQNNIISWANHANTNTKAAFEYLDSSDIISAILLNNGSSSGKITDIEQVDPNSSNFFSLTPSGPHVYPLDDIDILIGTGEKIPLYTSKTIPIGYGPAGNKTLALLYGGRPDPAGPYIKNNIVYDGAGNVIGNYRKVLISETQATSYGWTVATAPEITTDTANTAQETLYLRIKENTGGGDDGAAVIDTVSFATTTLLAASLQTSTVNSIKYTTHSSIPDDIFLQIYIQKPTS